MKRSALIILVLVFAGFITKAQDFSLTSMNDYENPLHRDRVGDWARGDTLKVKGTYTAATATSVRLRLLTFKKDTWTNPLATHEVAYEGPFSGMIDTFLVIPEDYMLGVADGDDANTQMLQISVEFDGFDRGLANLYLNIIAERPVHKTFIDFDEDYGVSSGQTLVNNIGTALSGMQKGDTILFKSAEYDFEGNSLNIEKAIVLTGAFPADVKKDSVGAQGVLSSFINMKNFNVRSSNITLTNMRFVPVETIGYVFTRFSHSTQGKYYTNIKVSNVIFDGGNLQCYGQNGAGMIFRNVSFLNFADGGYNCNRNQAIDSHPKSTFNLCHFVPNWDEVFYNTRGISMDAGNDNHPITWDASGMHIDSCLFDGNGIGWSKGANALVTNNHFIGYRGDVDMIHFEEYTNNIHVEGNLFEYSKPSRTFFIDRELQPLSDITIINNTFKGKYKFIFWGNSQFNLRFEGNDLTQASANEEDYLTFDFTAYHQSNSEKAIFSMPMENLIIRNNPGLNKSSVGRMSVFTLKGDDSNIIEGYPSAKIENQLVDFRPKPLLDTTLLYRIVNKASGEVMVAVDGSINVQTTAELKSDSSDIWKVSFVYPFTYTFMNMKTKQYMEIFNIYTLGDYSKDPASLPVYHVEQKSDWHGKSALPHWLLTKLNLTGEGEFQIYPGTNEKKSRVIKSDHDVVLDLAQDKDAGDFKPADASSTWWFVDAQTVGINKNSLHQVNVYPNPTSGTITVDIENVGSNAMILSVYDIKGRLVENRNLSSKTSGSINLQHLAEGIYTIVLNSVDEVYRSKLIIQ